MKKENLAILIAIAAFIFWIAENIYFGWNREPESALEGFCDTLALFGLFMAFLVKPVSNTQTTNYTINGGDLKVVRN